MSQFTVTVKGAGLIDSTTEKNITQAATYVGNLLDCLTSTILTAH